MMKKTSILSILVPLFLLSLALPIEVFAQQYSFSVPHLKMQVFALPNSEVKIIYDISFQNSVSGRTIDVVDIGMPHAKYFLSNMKAALKKEGGVFSISDIRRSEYVNPGVEVRLGRHGILKGQTAELHFEFTIPNLIYQDTTDKTYASLRITPTWFNPRFVKGSTRVEVAILAHPGIRPEELKYQDIPFSNKALYVGLAAGIWQTTRPLTSAYLVGMSFPRRGLANVIELSSFDLLIKWFKERPSVQLGYSLLLLALFAFFFFRSTGGTGITVFVVLLGIFVFVCAHYPGFHLLAIIPLVILIFFSERGLRKKKLGGYLPAIAEIEGGGIKRGLTAPEAAVLLEMPFSKVLTLTIFGMIKKGILEMVSPSPLAVRISNDFLAPISLEMKQDPKELIQAIREQVASVGGVFHAYEGPFFLAIHDNQNMPLSEIDFSAALKSLIKGVVRKMKNFDLSDTRDYYRRQINSAIETIKGIEEVKVREQQIDNKLEWLLLGDNYSEAIPDTYSPQWHRPSPGKGLFGGTSSTGSPIPASGGTTSLSDVGASFAGWAENTMGGMAESIVPSVASSSSKGGFIDLSGVDRVTEDIFSALSSSSDSGGHGGCACAGCACACACAGGGR